MSSNNVNNVGSDSTRNIYGSQDNNNRNNSISLETMKEELEQITNPIDKQLKRIEIAFTALQEKETALHSIRRQIVETEKELIAKTLVQNENKSTDPLDQARIEGDLVKIKARLKKLESDLTIAEAAHSTFAIVFNKFVSEMDKLVSNK